MMRCCQETKDGETDDESMKYPLITNLTEENDDNQSKPDQELQDIKLESKQVPQQYVTCAKTRIAKTKEERNPIIHLRALGGLTGPMIRSTFDNIAHQTNSMGMEPGGLAGSAAFHLPYGDLHRHRRPMGHEGWRRNIAIEADRSTAGTITVFLPNISARATKGGKPAVICMSAQWDLGEPRKHEWVRGGLHNKSGLAD